MTVGIGAEPSLTAIMVSAAAAELRNRDVCLVGVGLPSLAANVAKRTHAPLVELVYESGIYDAHPSRRPLSVGDPALVTGATSVTSMLDLLGYYVQGGRIDVGFLGAAQIDRWANINTTVIGPYRRPTTRLPGSGGACEIALHARRLVVILRQSRRSFVERVDFITSPGVVNRPNGELRPTVVVTDLAIYRSGANGELLLHALHPGVRLEDVVENSGWTPEVAATITVTPTPSEDVLIAIRAEDSDFRPVLDGRTRRGQA